MQRFGSLAALIALNLAFGAFVAHAGKDTAAQAAARAALEQQLSQMDTEQAAGATNAPTGPQPQPQPSATPEPKMPPMSMPTPQFSTNVPMTSETESEMAPAKMSVTNQPATAEMNTRSNVAGMTVPPPAVLMTNEGEQYPVNPPMAPLPPAQSEAPTQPPPMTPLIHPVSGAQSGPGASTPGGQEVPPSIATGPGPSLNNEPHSTNSVPNFDRALTAPPLPISQEKQAELQNLLSQYMANQITPAQYQEDRAKIMAEP